MNRVMMTSDRGVGLAITMMVMLVIVGLTGTVISLATTHTAVAANYRRSLELLYAAEAALELVVQDLDGWLLGAGVARPSAVSDLVERRPGADG